MLINLVNCHSVMCNSTVILLIICEHRNPKVLIRESNLITVFFLIIAKQRFIKCFKVSCLTSNKRLSCLINHYSSIILFFGSSKRFSIFCVFINGRFNDFKDIPADFCINILKFYCRTFICGCLNRSISPIPGRIIFFKSINREIKFLFPCSVLINIGIYQMNRFCSIQANLFDGRHILEDIMPFCTIVCYRATANDPARA